MRRREDESFELYKVRRAEENKTLRRYLKGRLIHSGIIPFFKNDVDGIMKRRAWAFISSKRGYEVTKYNGETKKEGETEVV